MDGTDVTDQRLCQTCCSPPNRKLGEVDTTPAESLSVCRGRQRKQSSCGTSRLPHHHGPGIRRPPQEASSCRSHSQATLWTHCHGLRCGSRHQLDERCSARHERKNGPCAAGQAGAARGGNNEAAPRGGDSSVMRTRIERMRSCGTCLEFLWAGAESMHCKERRWNGGCSCPIAAPHQDAPAPPAAPPAACDPTPPRPPLPSPPVPPSAASPGAFPPGPCSGSAARCRRQRRLSASRCTHSTVGSQRRKRNKNCHRERIPGKSGDETGKETARASSQ